MPESSIIVENVSKRYELRHRGAQDLRLRHVIENAALAPFRWAKRAAAGARGASADLEEFWALRDVSLEAKAGEAIGVIGRNGAGKSTLLKILSRITPPTRGRVRLRGRVSSLLEVGTGFHPELTGRENIFLNGAILGMSKAEIRRKFDEMVAFAEVERFLDTPVKRYSSGMSVRLAFAVAAHLEPDILLVDEVLAVGDLAFQQKCLGKMGEVADKEGRTVIFVSHNLGAISALTQRTLYLKEGRPEAFCRTPEAVGRYLADTFKSGVEWRAPTRTGHPLQILAVRLLDASGNPAHHLEASDGFIVEVEYEVRQRQSGAVVEIFIYAADGTHLVTLGDYASAPDKLINRNPGRYRARVRLPGDWLNVGSYYLHINSGLQVGITYDSVETFSFNLVNHAGGAGAWVRRGHLVPRLPWEQVQHQALDSPREITPQNADDSAHNKTISRGGA